MKKIILSCLMPMACALWAAVPEVSNVEFSQDAESQLVTVTYDLSGTDGIIIAEFFTNGASIGWANMRNMSRDVNRVVSPGAGKTIWWRPERDWNEGGKISSGTLKVKVYAYPTNLPPDYMAVDLCATKARFYYPSEDALPDSILSRRYRTTMMLFRRIPAANRTFTAGAHKWENGYQARESAHSMTLTNDFYLGVFPVTQAQYMNISHAEASYVRDNPSSHSGSDASVCPVNNMSGARLGMPYNAKTKIDDIDVDAHQLIHHARVMTGFERLYLPTRAEWEFACRAGSDGPVYGGYSLDEVAWHAGNSEGTTQPVGLKKPNAFGLYDMLGNVAERVRDSATAGSYSGELIAHFNGTGSTGGFHAMCGGAFNSDPATVRIASWINGSNAVAVQQDGKELHAKNQNYYEPAYGVRLLIPLD